ncbi:MAG: hypothetical protein AAF969_17360 [Bacteroidota bacterium]
MKKQRIYLDTSVFGGLFDEEFKEHTEPLFERIDNDEFDIISNVTTDELRLAPQKIRMRANSIPKNAMEFVKSDVDRPNLPKDILMKVSWAKHPTPIVCTLPLRQFTMRTS